MYLISAEIYKNAEVNLLIIRNSSEIWVSMKDVYSGLGFKNMSDLVLKEIYGRYGKKISRMDRLKNITFLKSTII